uniref:Uncharacterized protein n=1 Tax=Arundo donax TaxID=35708 RepID=A0A0A8ZVR9_ARUDO
MNILSPTDFGFNPLDFPTPDGVLT